MSILKDLLDVLKTSSELAKSGKLDDAVSIKSRPKSLSEKAKEGILQFPVIAENSIDIATLSSTTKALEKNYAAFVQIVYAMNPVAKVSDKDGIGNYLGKFHQNMNVKGSLNNLYVNVSENYGETELKECILECEIFDGATNKIIAENRMNLYDVMESFRQDALNDKYKPIVSEYDIYSAGKATGVFESNKDKEQDSGQSDKEMELQKSGNFKESKITKEIDFKKANELIPTSMVLRINFQDPEGRIMGSQDFVIGIKCIMHPVNSKEMIGNLSNISRGKFFDFIRWTSGEIEFFKDFVLNIKEIKTDIANRSAGSNPLWLALKNRSNLAKINNRTGLPGQLLPNATIIVSKESIDYLGQTYGLDYMDPAMTRKIMEKFFLLGFVVVDESQQIVHIMYDGDGDFQSYSFEGLDYEGKSKSGDLKDMLKMINRM